MEQVAKLLLGIHIAAGFASILIFWIPTLNKKGSNAHRKIGKIYINLMWVVVGTAALLCIRRFYQGHIDFAMFLGFLALITSRPIWYGIAILRYKKDVPLGFKNKHNIFKIIIFIYGVMMMSYGIYFQSGMSVVMIAFGIFGLMSGWEVWKSYKSRNISSEVNWLKEHLDGMFSSGIAAYTAFLVFGSRQTLSQYLDGYWMLIPWLMPTVVGFALIGFYKRKYKAKKAIA